MNNATKHLIPALIAMNAELEELRARYDALHTELQEISGYGEILGLHYTLKQLDRIVRVHNREKQNG